MMIVLLRKHHHPLHTHQCLLMMRSKGISFITMPHTTISILKINLLFSCSDDLSVATLLRSHRVRKLPIENDQNYQSIVIRRKHIFKDTIDHLKNFFIPQKYMRVIFSGEPAVDNGGPLREFFNLLILDISKNNSVFCGPRDSRCIMHNMIELDKKTYYYIGMSIALSLIYGGPAPHFFSPTIAKYIAFGSSASSASFLDIPDTSIKEKLIKV